MFIGVDIGTTGTKVALVDPAVGVVASASLPVTASSPHPGWAEADPNEWWANVGELIPKVLSEAGVDAAAVCAVACSGMVPAVLVTDASGRPRRAAILQSDARAGAEINEIAERLTDPNSLLKRTGSALTQQSVAPTLLWLRHHEPKVLDANTRIVGSYDWLAWQLGAEPHVEANWALESGLFNLDGSPEIEVWSAAEVASDWVPAVHPPATIVGLVSASAAEHTGLLAATPIVVGGADHVLSAYAAGLADAGDWLVKLGGAGDILVVTRDIVVDQRLYLDHHPAPGMWMPNGCMASSGSLLRWWQRILGPDSPPALDVLDAEARMAEPAQLIVLPYFLGEKSPLHDPELRGAVLGLHLGTTRGDLHRASLEAIGFGFRHHVDVFRDIGIQLGHAKVTNGGSRSRLWKEILASILNTPLTSIVDHPGASLGAALLAAHGTGDITDWTVPAHLVRVEQSVNPDPHLVAIYDEAYQKYLQAGEMLTPLSHDLTRRQVSGSSA